MLRQTGATSHFSAKMLRIFLSLILCSLSIQSIGPVESAPVSDSPSDTLHVKSVESRTENNHPEFADDLKDTGRHGDAENFPPADIFDQVSSTGEDEYSPDFVPPLGGELAGGALAEMAGGGVKADASSAQYMPQPVRHYEYEYEYEYEEDEGMEEAEDPENPAPKYMVDLYNKFSTDRYSHPMANIVRSFENMNQETSHGLTPFGNKTRVHTLMFNVTSVSRDEEMYLAELRLYTLVEADRNRYLGVDRTVSVYEVHTTDIQDYGTEKTSQMISTKHIYGRNSGWETFTITDAVKRWVKSRMLTQLLEVHIDTFEGEEKDGGLDISTRPNRAKGPLLVVFSNDKRRRNENRELHEIIAHEMEFYDDTYEDDISDINYYDEYDDENVSENKVYKRDVTRQQRQVDQSVETAEQSSDTTTARKLNKNKNKSTVSVNRTQYTKQLYEQLVSAQNDGDTNGPSEHELAKIYLRTKRSKPRKKKRNICRRKPMYVNFEDVNWQGWIIAPKGYQAYECTGKCYFPLSDHLTPTKHAIIQTLLHTNHPDKASKACCVPTKLDPISILYIDEQGVVTYKYKYDGMKVAECGCR